MSSSFENSIHPISFTQSSHEWDIRRTAFEEALYIRQKALGPGALEVAETTNNIWMILHEQRCEMEEEMNNGNNE